MKKFPLHWLLVLTATILLGANWQMRRGKHQPGVPAGSSQIAASPWEPTPPDSAKARSISLEKQTVRDSAEAPVLEPTGSAAPVGALAVSPRTFDWANAETSDYKQYVRNLRAMGFPEDLVRRIAIADVDKLYEPKEKPLKPRLVAYDAPMEQRQTHDISAEDWQRIKDLWQVRIEKQGVLEEILGTYVPREILRTPISRNYEAYEYAIGLLPPEKRNAVQLAQETEILTEGMNKVSIQDRAQELESFKRTRQERDAAMLRVLTPGEFETYEMNTTPAGTELARRVIGMEATEDEFRAMYQIASKNWLDTGGVYGRWRALPVPKDQIAAADQEMDASMRGALGPSRYADYRMAISGTGQQLRNFAARFDLPRAALERAFDLQTQMDQIARTQKQDVNSAANLAGDTSLQQIAPLDFQLQSVLGETLWQAWQEGRNLRVKLDP
jgi:hypothetical protein